MPRTHPGTGHHGHHPAPASAGFDQGCGYQLGWIVHQLQVVDDELPETAHDFSVDLIVTPQETIACGPARRPIGIIADHLTAAKIRDIPVLAPYARS